MGLYEDFIMQDLLPAIKKELPVSVKKKNWCLHGGSSGGYGALFLGSKFTGEFWGGVGDCPR